MESSPAAGKLSKLQVFLVMAAVGGPMVIVGWVVAFLALSSAVSQTPDPGWFPLAIGAGLLWLAVAGIPVAFHFKDRLAPGWRGAVLLYATMGAVGVYSLATGRADSNPSLPMWALVGFFGLIGAAAFLMREDWKHEVPRVKPEAGTVPATPRPHVLAIGAILAGGGAMLAFALSGIPFGSSDPGPSSSGTGDYVWIGLGNVTQDVTIPGAGALYLVAEYPTMTGPAAKAPANTTRLEMRILGNDKASVLRAEVRSGGTVAELRATGGANGVWAIEDARLAGAEVRLTVQQEPVMEDRTFQLVLTFQAQGIVWCTTTTFHDGTQSHHCDPARMQVAST